MAYLVWTADKLNHNPHDTKTLIMESDGISIWQISRPIIFVTTFRNQGLDLARASIHGQKMKKLKPWADDHQQQLTLLSWMNRRTATTN